MTLSPYTARLALGAFLAISAGTAVNVLYLQGPSRSTVATRAKAEKVKQQAETDRARRLALAPKEAAEPTPQPQPKPVAVAVAVTKKAAGPEPTSAERVGRFAPSSGQLDRAPPPAQPPPTAASLPQPQAPESEARYPEVVRSVQQILGQKGYEPGTPDGVAGIVTRAAVMAYEHDQGLALTGEPSEQVLRQLQGLPPAKDTLSKAARVQRAAQAEQVTRSVQQSLAGLGYFSAKIDGRTGEETVRAIREYEMDAGLVPTGRVSAPLLLRLARSASSTKAANR